MIWKKINDKYRNRIETVPLGETILLIAGCKTGSVIHNPPNIQHIYLNSSSISFHNVIKHSCGKFRLSICTCRLSADGKAAKLNRLTVGQ